MNRGEFTLHASRFTFHVSRLPFPGILHSALSPPAGHREAARFGRPAYAPQGRSYRGFNPFLEQDERVLQTLRRGEPALAGVTARRLRSLLQGWTRGRVSRLLKRFRLHGWLRKMGHTYTYHQTPLARRIVTAVLDIKNTMMVPQLATGPVEN